MCNKKGCKVNHTELFFCNSLLNGMANTPFFQREQNMYFLFAGHVFGEKNYTDFKPQVQLLFNMEQKIFDALTQVMCLKNQTKSLKKP